MGNTGRLESAAPKSKGSCRSCAAAGLQNSRGSHHKASSSGLIHPCLQVRSVVEFGVPPPPIPFSFFFFFF